MNKLRNGYLPALTGLAIMVLLACACAESARLSPPTPTYAPRTITPTEPIPTPTYAPITITPREPAPTPTYTPRTITGFWPDLEGAPVWILLSNDHASNNLKGEISIADDRVGQYDVIVRVKGVESVEGVFVEGVESMEGVESVKGAFVEGMFVEGAESMIVHGVGAEGVGVELVKGVFVEGVGMESVGVEGMFVEGVESVFVEGVEYMRWTNWKTAEPTHKNPRSPGLNSPDRRSRFTIRKQPSPK